MRLPLAATAAAAVLFGAVVVFGLGPASPLALGPDRIHRAPVVRVPHDLAVSGPVQRRPQASPGPERQRLRANDRQKWTPVAQRPTATPRPQQPAGPRTGVSTPSAPSSGPAVQLPTLPTEVTASALPSPPTPLPEVIVPTVTLPPLPPPLPPLPSTPSLPSAPSLPLPSELPG